MAESKEKVMQIWEILLISIALAMDAVAVGMTNGMAEPHMKWGKILAVAGAFGLFQFLMPVLGYYCGYAFSTLVEKIAPWLAFAILFFIGGKMIVDGILERREKKEEKEQESLKPLGVGKLLVQAVATSLDALAIGVTLLAVETAQGLPMSALWCSVVIGAVTFLLVLPAALLGKKVGDRFAVKSEFPGAILLIIAIKILIEGLL